MARVLVVDDDPEVRSAVRRLLQRMGHEVSEAGDGRAALQRFEEVPADLIITDINMPGMDGIEVITAFRRLSPGTPVIAMSGGGRLPKELLLDSAGMLGAISTIAKPFDALDVQRAVERALDEADPR